jgi:hypothetical protein
MKMMKTDPLVWFGVSGAGSDVKDFGDGFWRWRR